MYTCTTLLATFKDTALFFVCKRTMSKMKSCISSILNVYATLANIWRTKEINKAFWLVHIFIQTITFSLLGRKNRSYTMFTGRIWLFYNITFIPETSLLCYGMRNALISVKCLLGCRYRQFVYLKYFLFESKLSKCNSYAQWASTTSHIL